MTFIEVYALSLLLQLLNLSASTYKMADLEWELMFATPATYTMHTVSIHPVIKELFTELLVAIRPNSHPTLYCPFFVNTFLSSMLS